MVRNDDEDDTFTRTTEHVHGISGLFDIDSVGIRPGSECHDDAGLTIHATTAILGPFGII